MKKYLILLVWTLVLSSASAQTAVDFTSTDCSGTSFNLFTELNSGKVIVLCWVMPCGACTGPALTTLNVVQSYMSSYPHTVYMYLVDDYANTTCTSLDSWKDNNGLTAANSFSDAAISMADYGTIGMPKIVVIAGGAHTVFYNANNTVNATDLQQALNNAVSVIGIDEKESLTSSMNIFPNPASGKASVRFSLVDDSNVTMEIFDMQGKSAQKISCGRLAPGEHQIEINTSGMASGTYLLKAADGTRKSFSNLVVAH